MSDLSDEEQGAKMKIEVDDAMEAVTGESFSFPTYTRQLINIANQNAQGTRPEVVGQMSELIQECPERTIEGWKQWYTETHPDAIDRAVERIKPMIDNFREALERIDEEMIRNWVKDLVLYKTAEGLIIQEAILRAIGERWNEDWTLAESQDESRNIDGYVGETPVSIKPESYRSKDASVRETIDVPVIYYKKTSKYLHIYPDELEGNG